MAVLSRVGQCMVQNDGMVGKYSACTVIKHWDSECYVTVRRTILAGGRVDGGWSGTMALMSHLLRVSCITGTLDTCTLRTMA